MTIQQPIRYNGWKLKIPDANRISGWLRRPTRFTVISRLLTTYLVYKALFTTFHKRSDGLSIHWPQILQWLETEPGITARRLHDRLVAMAPALYSKAQLRTLQRRVKAWRSNRAKELVIRMLGDAESVKSGAATLRQTSPRQNRPMTTTRE